MKKPMRRFMSAALSVMLTFSLAVGNGQKPVKAASVSKVDLRSVLAKNLANKSSEKLSNAVGDNFDDNAPRTNKNPDEIVRVIVQMVDKPAAESNSFNLKTATAKLGSIKASASRLEGASIRHTYTNLVNGFSMDVKRSEINKLKAMDGVASVSEANRYYPDMQYAKSLTQAYDTWQDLGLKGEGTVVAVIDTGIDYTHKDFQSIDTSKIKIKDKNPTGYGKYFTDKVPYGYNFADGNQEVVDTTTSMHGMHVAGIVGANGTDATEIAGNKAVQGVAPQAQLLAMKVFSNNPENGGAYEDDIVAAIEDSVAHGADVINMSLGSTAAFQDPENAEQKAVKNATDKGVVVVISAGNSYASTGTRKFEGVVDTGLVGAPGLAHESIQVASSENSQIVASALDFAAGSTTGTMAYFTSDIDPVGVLNGQFEIVDCGLGLTTDFTGKDLTGKIALVKRGSITFVEKKLNAQAAKAAGVIVWNRDGDETYLSMQTDPAITIPGIFIKNTDGAKLQSLIASGLKVSFNGKLSAIANTVSGDMSDFTSWGPTPNLDFKPEITAPGGNIWSTVNKDKYENMSGTSMAAPHTSGAEALILQGVKAKNLGLSARTLADFLKRTSINTAVPQRDLRNSKDLPYSPRRQGAGMVQIKNAIENNVIVTYNNEATVALKEFKTKTVKFTMTLTNYGSADAAYAVGTYGGVLTEIDSTKAGIMPYEVQIAGATITFDKNNVTVPAKGNATVEATITLPDALTTERFIEGFVRFTGTNVPNLGMPFMGFYGDWSKPATIDAPLWEANSINGWGTLLTTGPDDYYFLGQANGDIDPNKIAISPNADMLNDDAMPILTMLRNAKTMEVQVLDSNKNVIRTVGTDTDVRKNALGDSRDPGYRLNSKLAWDGTLYNAATGKYETAPEGQYYINVKTWVDYAGATAQNYELPLKVDVSAPVIDFKSSVSTPVGKYTLKWTAAEVTNAGASGLNTDDMVILQNGKPLDGQAINFANGVYSTELTLAEGVNSVMVGVIDFAGNIGMKELKVRTGNVKFGVTFYGFENGYETTNPELQLAGELTFPVKTFQINGKNVTVNDDLTFETNVTLTQGINKVSVYAEDFDGTVLQNYSYRANLDAAAPVIELTSPVVDKDGKAFVNGDTVVVKGKVTDNGFGYNFFVNGDSKFTVNQDTASEITKEFEVTVAAVNNGVIELKAVDSLGNETVKNITVVIDKVAPVVTVTAVEEGKTYEKIKPVINVNDPDAVITMTLNGKAYNGEEITAEGTYKLVVTAVDKAGNSTTSEYNFTVKKAAPTTPPTTPTIPKTGSMVDFNGMMASGAVLMVLGLVLARRKRNAA